MTLVLRKITDQSMKILVCLSILFCFLYVQPRTQIQQANAAIPLLVPVLTGIVGDIAVDMGMDFIDKKAQKAKSENVAAKVWNKYSKDLQKLKPTKKNMGKWALNVPKWLGTAIVDELGDIAEDVIEKDKDRSKKWDLDGDGDSSKYTAPSSEVVTGETDPYYKTNVNVQLMAADSSVSAQSGYAYFLKYGSLEIEPKAYEQKSDVSLCIANDCKTITYSGGTYITLSAKLFDNSGVYFQHNTSKTGYPATGGSYFNGSAGLGGLNYYNAFQKYKQVLSSKAKTVYEFEGVLVDDDAKSVVKLDDNLTPEQLKRIDYSKLPTAYQNDREYEYEIEPTTNIDLSTYNDGDEIEWEVIQKDVEYKVQNETIYNTYNFDYEPVINNYYTMTPEKQTDLDKQITIIVNTDIDNDNDIDVGGGSGDGFKYCVDKTSHEIVSCKDIESIDGGLIEYIKNSYDYAVNAVKAGADGVKTIVAGSAGLLTLYSEVFDWLPDEATTILTSGLLLMIGLRVFRK